MTDQCTRLIVISDKKGEIVALGQLRERAEQHSGIESISVDPAGGHRSHILPMPEEFEDLELAEVARSAYLDLSGSRPQLKLRKKK